MNLPFQKNEKYTKVKCKCKMFWSCPQSMYTQQLFLCWGLCGLPVKATVRPDVCYLWVFLVVKHLCCENRRLVNEHTQRNISHLWDFFGQTNDGRHVAFRHCDPAERQSYVRVTHHNRQTGANRKASCSKIYYCYHQELEQKIVHLWVSLLTLSQYFSTLFSKQAWTCLLKTSCQ